MFKYDANLQFLENMKFPDEEGYIDNIFCKILRGKAYVRGI